MASFSKGSGYSKSDLIDSGTPLILYGRLYTKYETVITEVDTYAEEKKVVFLVKAERLLYQLQEKQRKIYLWLPLLKNLKFYLVAI